MRLTDLLNEDNQAQQKPTDPVEEIINLINNKNWTELLTNISKPKTGSKAAKGFNFKDSYIEFCGYNGKASSDFIDISKALRSACNNNIKKVLAPTIAKCGNSKDFINTTLIPALIDPATLTKVKDQLVSPSHYKNIGKALVYRSHWFVSKMADASTKINQNTLNQVMIDSFNQMEDGGRGENESFLMQFTDMKQKMELDAAKQTVAQVEGNGAQQSDGEQKLGENPNKEESYYSNVVHTYDVLIENDEKNIPRSVADFDTKNLKRCLEQVKAAKATWPRQFKYWFDKFNSEFEEGVKEGQDDVRDTSKKELTDPLTGKKLSGRKTLGSGGPNAWLRDFKEKNPTAGKWIDELDTAEWNAYNMGPKLVLKLFSAIEKGGKVLQDICDGCGSALKDIKQAFKSGSSVKDMNKKIDEQTEGGDYGSANAFAEAVAVIQFTQLLDLMQNGPIGTINLTDETFSTAMSNSQTSLEVAVQNLLASLDKYTDTAKRFEENKDVPINAEQMDSVLNDGSDDQNKNKEENKDKNQQQDKKKEEAETEEGADNINASFIPTLKNFILTEEENEEDKGNKVSSDDPDEESKGTSQSDSRDQTLAQLDIIKKEFDDTVDIDRLKFVQETLEKLKGNGEVVTDSEGNEVDYSKFNKIIDLYKLITNDDLKFNLDAASLKDFLEGIKNGIDEFKDIEPIENIKITIGDLKRFPAMDAEGQKTETEDGNDKAAKLIDVLEKFGDHILNTYIKELHPFASSCKNDQWLSEYSAKIDGLKNEAKKLADAVKQTYGTEGLPDWWEGYFNEFENKNYLSKLYMLMAAASSMKASLEEQTKDSPKKADNESTVILPILHSLYLAEQDETPNNNEEKPSNETKNDQNNKNQQNVSQFDMVKHSIETLDKRLNLIKLNDKLLPTDLNAEIYKANDVEKFNKATLSFATSSQTGLSIHEAENGNGIVSIVRNIIRPFTEEGNDNLKILQSFGCAKLATIFSPNDKSRYNSDLYIHFAGAYGIKACLSANLEKAKQQLDMKKHDNGKDDTTSSSAAPENNGSTSSSDTSQQASSAENSKTTSDSIQYPNVSQDSFLNEIYKYIRG